MSTRLLPRAHLARAFGNDQFSPIEPAWLMTYVAENHEGWRAVDDARYATPRQGLPYHLGETPPALLIQKSVTSPDYNQQIHPWCGFLSSMHSWGLYNCRYGISDAISIEQGAIAYAGRIQEMLDGELARRSGLKRRC